MTLQRFIKKNSILILVIILIIFVALTGYLYTKASAPDMPLSFSETKSLIKKVERVVVLPQDEVPTIATVSDPEALRDQTFFADAKVGDKVLIYSNARKAILFDPKAEKVINIAPLNAGTSVPQSNSSPLTE